MKLLNRFIGIIKGEDFKIDPSVNITYLINKIFSMFVSILRANIKCIFVKKKSCIFFLGRKSKIKCKNKICIGRGVNVGDNVLIDALSKDGIIIGDNVRISDYTRIICTGTLRNIGKGIQIGNNCGIGDNCFLGAAGGINIGNDVIMGQNVRFHSENHKFEDKETLIRHQGVSNKGISVGNNCWIGSGVVILDGVMVGDGCVIGANALVNKSLPDNCIAVGNPVKIIRYR